MMTDVRHSRYSREQTCTTVPNYKRVIFEKVNEFEESLDGIDEGWDEDLLNDPFEFQQRLLESHEPRELLLFLVDERITKLEGAEPFIGVCQAASILGLSWHEINEDIANGHIPVTGGSLIRSEQLKAIVEGVVGG
jgi:hypothetical protein